MIKINFKQPKYIFPLVIFVPLCALVYFVMQTFSGGEETAGAVATDRINMELPQANAEEAGGIKLMEGEAITEGKKSYKVSEVGLIAILNYKDFNVQVFYLFLS